MITCLFRTQHRFELLRCPFFGWQLPSFLMGNLCPWVVRLHTDHMYRVGYVYCTCFFVLPLVSSGVSLIYKKVVLLCVISKKEIQEIRKPSNKHPVKLLQWKPFGVLWSPMTPTERTVGSRTAKAFRKMRKKWLAAAGGDFCMGKNTNHHNIWTGGCNQTIFSKVQLGLVVYASSKNSWLIKVVEVPSKPSTC